MDFIGKNSSLDVEFDDGEGYIEVYFSYVDETGSEVIKYNGIEYFLDYVNGQVYSKDTRKTV